LSNKQACALNQEQGIDWKYSGGTNLRVGFVELLPRDPAGKTRQRLSRHLEKSWPIDDQLKNENAESLFGWIGRCIAEVVKNGTEEFGLPRDTPIPLGVAFSFPMEQRSLSEASLMSMGKGFAISSKLDLGSRLLAGYSQANVEGLPPIQVAAIANDSVSTLVSFIYKYEDVQQRASMGLILGTGCNATIPLKLSQLHPSKRPANVNVLPGESVENVKIAVNTEWSINGTAPPLHSLGWINQWDEILDSQNEIPGFQPLEYMTAGRYLGELGRLVLVDYMTTIAGIPKESLPKALLRKQSITTTFLSHFKPLDPKALKSQLEGDFPSSTSATSFTWTEELAGVLYHIAKAIEVRAAGIVAAAIVALLEVGGEIPAGATSSSSGEAVTGTGERISRELGVGYTGGCIVHFQDYLADCQGFIDELMEQRTARSGTSAIRVVLNACHDGGVTGAGILVAAALASEKADR
jgi:hexokinase